MNHPTNQFLIEKHTLCCTNMNKTTNTTNHPWKNGTTQRIHSGIGNYSLQHLDTTQKAKQAPKQERFFSSHQILYPRPPIITICFSERPNPPLFSNPPRLL